MICRDQAVVLNTRDFRETSKIAIFYCRKYGKVSGLLKGIRANPRKFASNLDFLSLNEVIFYKKRFSELHLVSECDLKRSFNSLRSNLVKFNIGSFCSEFINSIMAPEDAHPEIFDLLLNFLDSLESTSLTQKLVYNFVLKGLSLSGFQPHLESCVSCKSLIQKQAFFSNKLGGLLCNRCLVKDRLSEPILGGTIATIVFFQNKDWQDSLRLNILPKVEEELSKIIFSFLSFNLERKFKTLEYLQESFKERATS